MKQRMSSLPADMPRGRRWPLPLVAALLLLFLVGCTTTPPVPDRASAPMAPDAWTPVTDRPQQRREGRNGEDQSGEGRNGSDDETFGASTQLFPGTGQLFDQRRAARPVEFDRATGEYVLNFENASLREVTQLILGEMLERNVLIDEGIEGRVTLQTTRPLPESALLSVLEDLLRINGAAMIESEGMIRVTRRNAALRGQLSPRTGEGGAGLNVRIVPLEFVGAAEMIKILEPFLGEESLVRVDPARNLLMLAGTRRELAHWQDTIDIFDVDWLQGLSVGLFTLRYAEVQEVAQELEQLIHAEADSPLAGVFRVIPVQRLNALLVVTPQARYLKEARVWIERLDQGVDTQAGLLHVYRMQHGRAIDAAEVLSAIFGTETATRVDSVQPTRAAAGGLAPGVEPARLQPANAIGAPRGAGTAGEDRARALTIGDAATGTSARGGGANAMLAGETRIVADDVNNSLLIYASIADYETIGRALQQLDIPPLQVLIDATIIEISLQDELRYGLQWFFKDSLGSSYRGEGVLANALPLGRSFPGFNYSIVDSANQVRAVLNALAEDSQLNVLSSPSVMVLDNRSATIRVGDQVPIRGQETTSVVTDTPVTISNILYRDTGVSLTVTPRVNAGGMVQLEIAQEVNDVSSTTSSNIDSPTFLQRVIESSVAVQSGETIVLGGLIRESRSTQQSGIPVLYRLPVLGALFGSTALSTRRTELVVLLTPRVAEDMREATAITNEFRSRMRGLRELQQTWHPSPLPGEPASAP
jgi:general secretion pathway protein D